MESKKLNANIESSKLLQEYKFQEFVYNFLQKAAETGAIEDEITRLFIGPGYVLHHLLDAYTHPQIIYYAGDHTRDPNRDTWHHGIVENLIDVYLMEKEGITDKNYPVYKDFKCDQEISKYLLDTLGEALEKTYQIKDGAVTFNEAFYQLELFMRTMKYDPNGIKKIVLDKLDPILKGTSSFSYHQNSELALEYLNLEHEKWLNPIDETKVSTESFLDLYDKALKDGSYIINELEKICQTGKIKKDDIYSLIPNISSVHGLECGQKLKIKNIKYR